MRRGGGRVTRVPCSVLTAAGAALAGVLLALPLAPAAASAPAPAAVLPGPEVIDRATLTPILVGSGCAATSVILPVAGPVTWFVVATSAVVVDPSEPVGIDPASATRFRATLSQGARFTDGGTRAEWTVGPVGTDVVTGCTAPAPSSAAPPPATSSTSAPTGTPTTTGTTAPSRSAGPAPSPTGATGGGGRADATGGGSSAGSTSPAGGPGTGGATGTTYADDAASGTGVTGAAGSGSSDVAGGGTTGGGNDVTTDEPVLALAQPSVETRVLSNSFTRPEVSTTAAAVASPSGSGPSGATAPLAAVVALLAGSGLVAGLLLYRGARGTVRSGPRHQPPPIA
jgi:hypothetical protein